MLSTDPSAAGGPAASAIDEIRAAFIDLITSMVRMTSPPTAQPTNRT